MKTIIKTYLLKLRYDYTKKSLYLIERINSIFRYYGQLYFLVKINI